MKRTLLFVLAVYAVVGISVLANAAQMEGLGGKLGQVVEISEFPPEERSTRGIMNIPPPS